MTKRFAPIVVILALLAGCDTGTSPEDHVPAPGTYRYTATYQVVGGGQTRVVANLVIETAHPDSVSGRWEEVDEDFWSIQSEPFEFGFYNVDAYVVYGDVVRVGDTGRVGYSVNRIERAGGATELTCSGHMLRSDGNLTKVPGTCALVYVGP